MPEDVINLKRQAAIRITQDAAKTALGFFREREALKVEVKGLQDWVSNADKSVETEIRAALATEFPEDGIVGEEHGTISGSSGYVWVIDPIDGTTNFVNAMPGWCVVLACVKDNETVIGVIVDPIANETYSTAKGQAAYCNGVQLAVSEASHVNSGSVAVGHSLRIRPEQTLSFIESLMGSGGMFYRNGSGALMLAYVAAGRLLAYVEPHMNAWDCLAGLLLIQQAGGEIKPFDYVLMIEQGGSVVASAPGLYQQIDRFVMDANYP